MKTPAIFFIHPGSIGQASGAYPKMNWDQVRDLTLNPLFMIGSHSWMHLDLRTLTEKEVRDNFERTNHKIKSEIGYAPDYIVYPMGYSDEKVRKIAKSLYYYGFSYGSSAYSSSKDYMALPRVSVNQNNVNIYNPCK